MKDRNSALAVHQGLRVEFGRLAIAMRSPRDAAHAALLEEHLALMLDVLHQIHPAVDARRRESLLDRSAPSAREPEQLTLSGTHHHRSPQVNLDEPRHADVEIDRRLMPFVLGWLASCLEQQQFAVLVQQQPRLVQEQFRLFWWPSYQRRLQQLYSGVDLGPPTPARPARPDCL